MRLTEKDRFDKLINDVYSFKADIAVLTNFKKEEFLIDIEMPELVKDFGNDSDIIYEAMMKHNMNKYYIAVQDAVVDYISAYQKMLKDLY